MEVKNTTDFELVTYEPPYTFKAGEVKKVSKEHAALLLTNANFKEVKPKETSKPEKTEKGLKKLTK